jgi:hypothetical protein
MRTKPIDARIVVYALTLADVRRIAGRPALTLDQAHRIAACIPYSSIPEALGEVAGSVLEEIAKEERRRRKETTATSQRVIKAAAAGKDARR